MGDEKRHTCAMCWCHDAETIRADERAKVVARIRHEGNQWSHATKVILLDLANRIECSGPKPGQPKEGE
jgi:hypothetical protein